jgi:hypothetical protein
MIEQSRVVVATLEEARNTAVMAAMASHAFGYGSQDAIAACRALGEDGGWVGPLPDGTIIEVQRVSFLKLREMSGIRPGAAYAHMDAQQTRSNVLAAFNAS